LSQPVRARTLRTSDAHIAPPAAPRASAATDPSAGRHSVGVINFEAADLNGYIDAIFEIDGSDFYLSSCPASTPRPKWTGVISGTQMSQTMALAFQSEQAIWFGDPQRGDFGGVGGDEDPGGNPCINPIFTGTLTTVPVDVAPEDRAYLSFWSWEETEMSIVQEGFECYQVPQCEFDARRVSIWSEANQEWTLKWTTEPSPFPPTVEQNWHKVLIDISEYVGDQIRIRFEFDAVDRRNNNYRGWFLDEIVLETFIVNDSMYLPIMTR
jgi:hypothetical protein